MSPSVILMPATQEYIRLVDSLIHFNATFFYSEMTGRIRCVPHLKQTKKKDPSLVFLLSILILSQK